MLENQDLKATSWANNLQDDDVNLNVAPNVWESGFMVNNTSTQSSTLYNILEREIESFLGETTKGNKNEGLRFNQGKLRYDLIHPEAERGLVKVLTMGAEKYAERNWEKGMPWSKITASLKRHIAAIERGEDYDPESGLLHADHVQANAHFLSAYYKIAPQYDDRPHNWLKYKRVALDIDEVLADFTLGWASVYDDVDARPTSWYYDRNMGNRFNKMEEEGILNDFYMSLTPKVDPMEIPFEPICYITSRPVPSEVTEAWLDKHGFPRVKVITVPYGQSKVVALLENNIDLFIDDSFDNFRQATEAGICTYLWDAPHNRRYDVGFKRLKSFKDLC